MASEENDMSVHMLVANIMDHASYGCFWKLGALITRILLFGVYARAP